MGFNLPFIFALFTVAIVVNHAALTPELYWNKVLPGTSMPKAIRESLNPEFMQHKSAPITIGKASYRYVYDSAEIPPKDDPSVALFFLETDLVPGKTLNLQFLKAAGPVPFLPREMANSIPFSSHNFTNILKRFSINPESEEANNLRETITACEEPGILGEQKYCATSLESMVDFSTKILGKKNVKAVSTRSHEDTQIKKYKVEDNISGFTRHEKINAISVVCHKQAYIYAVFNCHSIKSTKIYVVPLRSENGTEVQAVGACHQDTSKWNPKHFTFQMLKVKPGTPICHFLPDDTVAWYRN